MTTSKYLYYSKMFSLKFYGYQFEARAEKREKREPKINNFGSATLKNKYF